MVIGARFYFTFVVSVFSFNNGNGDPCRSGTLTATKEGKHLTSPGYPLGYKNNLRCKWEIVGPQNSKIKVKILSTDIDGQGSCEGDYVEVLDGSTFDGVVASLGSFCGLSTPSFTSSGRFITIRFITDGSGTSKGFRLSYHYEDPQITSTAFLFVFGIFVGFILLFIVFYITSRRYLRKRHNRRIELETQHHTQVTEMPAEVVETPMNDAELSAPPPTYNEAVNSGSINNNKDNLDETCPPPFSTLQISDT